MENSVDKVFSYWLGVMGKNPKTCKLTVKRKKAISGRLKEGYELEFILQAVKGCSLDAWSMGQNNRNKPFNDIELICRSGEKLEHFAESVVESDLSFMNGSILDINANVIKVEFQK